MSIDDQKRMYYLRNKINRIKKGVIIEDDSKSWDELEKIFLTSTKTREEDYFACQK